ncbi:MAG TPA: peptidoglycan editing factor PgeF [Saprospiraceae bacterium]|nr:peptidoglycan editing factor PgeF [Saprospiraceae bacterium]
MLDIAFKPSILLAHLPDVVAGQSTRHGGVSEGAYASLNLGISTADDPQAVAENRRRFFAALGFDAAQTASAHQVHGDAVLHVQAPGRYDGYDALVTTKKDLLLNVTVADCTPILIYDPVNQAIAAVHAGWKGTVLQIVAKTLQKMETLFGTRGYDCQTFIGTCIDRCDYEVDEDVARHFDAEFAEWNAEKGKFQLDLKAANKAQLLAQGVQNQNIEVSPYSTASCVADFFSHRAEKGITGRMLAVIAMKNVP